MSTLSLPDLRKELRRCEHPIAGVKPVVFDRLVEVTNLSRKITVQKLFNRMAKTTE